MTAMRAHEPITVTMIGGPTVLLEIGWLRLLTDPSFAPPGEHRTGQHTWVRTSKPVVGRVALPPLDAVLLSHDQHPDNLDDEGRELLAEVPTVISTGSAACRLEVPVRALEPWHHTDLIRPDGSPLRVTAVPAHHGPDGTEHVVGEVIGFVLSGPGLPTVYISGDNASLAVVQAVADHMGPIDVAVLCAGRARTPLLDAYLTLSSDQAARAAAILGAPAVIPVHTDGWAHLTQPAYTLPHAFTRHGQHERLRMITPGHSATIQPR